MTKEEIKKKTSWKWYDGLLLNIFGIIGIFGWFLAIWIEEYRWRIFFTCLASFILALIYYSIKEDKLKEKNE